MFTWHRQGFYVLCHSFKGFPHESVKLVPTAFKGFSTHASNGFFYALNRFSVPSPYLRRVLLLQRDAFAMFFNNFP